MSFRITSPRGLVVFMVAVMQVGCASTPWFVHKSDFEAYPDQQQAYQIAQQYLRSHKTSNGAGCLLHGNTMTFSQQLNPLAAKSQIVFSQKLDKVNIISTSDSLEVVGTNTGMESLVVDVLKQDKYLTVTCEYRFADEPARHELRKLHKALFSLGAKIRGELGYITVTREEALEYSRSKSRDD